MSLSLLIVSLTSSSQLFNFSIDFVSSVIILFSSVISVSVHFSQFSSVTQLCPTLCDSMNCSTPGFPVLRHLPELAQTDIHWAGDAILSSVVPFSSHLQFFPASWSFLMSQLFATPWTAAHPASLSITNSQSLLKLMSISSSIVPFSSRLQSFPASGSFLMSRLFILGGQSLLELQL